jgi:thiol-disulfide isomerase/thioredoxin
MDRLPTLIAIALALTACESKTDKPVEPAARTNGAKVNTAQAVTTEAFCDRHAADDHGAAFHWPELAGPSGARGDPPEARSARNSEARDGRNTMAGGTAPAAPTMWRWVNVWATWCKPCIEEMPRLIAWRNKLAAAGKKVELSFVSVDDSDADVASFRKEHPDTPPSIRVASAEKRTAWLKGMGLDDGAIPIQLFVSPANRLRCARAGGIRDKDYPVVEKLLTE